MALLQVRGFGEMFGAADKRGYNGLMANPSPRPLTLAERRARYRHVVRHGRDLGFVGRVEYRHVYSQTGGAQYGRGSTANEDLLTVYAEAFERDADPEDFSLEAILAHERGHQLSGSTSANRQARRGASISGGSEEILASLLGAMHCAAGGSRCLGSQGNRGIAQPWGSPRSSDSAASRAVGPVGGIPVIGPKKLSAIREELRSAIDRDQG